MSVDQLPPRRPPRVSNESKLVEYDQYIDTQIQSTRRAVKAVDWATALVLLATGLIVFLLSAAIVEHWLVLGGFSVAVRTALFVLLVGGVAYFAYRRLWPLCRRAINPVYAAHTIEQSSPTLKNSLINLLLFRQHRSEISDAVYHTLEEQAAHGLTRVPVEAAVDRSHLIRFGYVLLAVVAVAAFYKVFSPKDPWIAAERVLMPWSDVVPASRVSIRDVQPGSLTVPRGEFINVSAEIRGIDDNDPVLLRYTTDDGQALDKPVPMRLADDGLRFEGRLPDEPETRIKVGVARNLKYRIEAGDARSLDYAVTVVPAPSILVERVEYDYPDYTGYVDRHVDGLGDIRAIEGTRVALHARANGVIDKAHVDFDADGRRDLDMTSNGTEARGSFVLALREDRQTPQHASYVLRFTNRDARANREPVKHPIVVDPDRSPETAILLPKEKSLDVRLNDVVPIEVEARDPDFALSEVRLRGEVAGRPVIDEPLLARRHVGRFTARYRFTPSAHDLRAGDVVQYWVVATDNRAPRANVAESERKLLRIMSPDPARQPPPDQIAQRDPRGQQRNQQQPGDQQPPDGGQPDAANQEGHAGKQQPGGAEQQRSRGQQPGANENQADGESANGNQEAEQQPRGENNDEQAPRENQPDGAAGSGQSPDSAQDGQGENQSGGQGRNGRQAKPGEQNSNGKQTGAGAAGGESSQKGSQPDGTRPDQQPAAGRPGGARGGDQQSKDNNQSAPVSSEGDNDAEAF